MPNCRVRLSSLLLAMVLPMAANAGNGVGVADRVTMPRYDGATWINVVSVPVDVLANDLGFNGPVTTVSVDTPPLWGTAVPTGSAGAMSFTYTPNTGFAGVDSFVYSVTDTVSSSSATVTITVLSDGDHDGVPNARDNCTQVANNEAGAVPNSPGVLKSQLDADGDGYGNVCDGDLNNSGLTTAQDNTILRNALNQTYNASANAAKSDLNGSGLVTAQDSTILRNRLNTAPGPSGLRTGGGTTGESYTVGGTVSGLTGSGLVLQNNLGDDRSVSANGPFAFATGVPSGAYSVTVLTQPSNPSQTCAVTAGSGTVGGAAPNVLVTCTTNSFPLSLNVSGRILSTDPLYLQSNSSAGTELLPVSGNSANISFPTALVSGSSYTVTVALQPKDFDQTCVIPAGGGTGTLGTAVAITVSCTTNGKFYYAVNTAASTISIYSLSSITGNLSQVGPAIPTYQSPIWVEADGTGRFAYVVGQGPGPPYNSLGRVSFYKIDDATGALTLQTTIATGRDPRHFTLDRTNTRAWVPNFGDDTVSTYSILANGTPQNGGPPVPTGDGPLDVDILTAQNAAGTLANAYAYVTVSGGNIYTYTISPEGTLAAVTTGIITSATGTPPILVIP